MQMTLDADSRVNLIRSYAPDELRIGERVLHESLLVTASTLIEKWDPRDLEAVFALKPDVVLLEAVRFSSFRRRRCGRRSLCVASLSSR